MNLTDPTALPVKILIVDDHPNTAALLARAISLNNSNVEIISATSGRQALEYLRDVAADIVITDMDMPEMNGLELIENLNRHPAGPPAFSFLLTASHVPGLKMAARRLKVEEVLNKPIHPEKVCQIVSQALDGMHLARLFKELIAEKRYTLLIADDEPARVTLLSRYLEAEGYTYITANDGKDTLKQIHTYYPDLILLGVNMSDPHGVGVLQEIRTDPYTQAIPVILLSEAWNYEAKANVDVHQGVEDYVTKPIDRREVLTLIRRKLLAKELERASISRKVM